MDIHESIIFDIREELEAEVNALFPDTALNEAQMFATEPEKQDLTLVMNNSVMLNNSGANYQDLLTIPMQTAYLNSTSMNLRDVQNMAGVQIVAPVFQQEARHLHDITYATPQPPPQDQVMPTAQVLGKRVRKPSVALRDCYQEEDEEFDDLIAPIPSSSKQKVGKPRGRRPKNAVVEPAAKVTTTTKSGSSRGKKVKLHELNHPETKNARAARRNREKKKEELQKAKMENAKLHEQVARIKEELQAKEVQSARLQEEMKTIKRNTSAVTGLNQNMISVKDYLEVIMPSLIQKYGRWQLQLAPWFCQVESNLSQPGGIQPAAAEALGLSNIDGSPSKFFTCHINVNDRILMVDYRPEDPVLSNIIPNPE